MFIVESFLEKYGEELCQGQENKVLGVFSKLELVDIRKAWVAILEFYDEAFLEPEMENHIHGMAQSLEVGTAEFSLQLYVYEVETDKICLK